MGGGTGVASFLGGLSQGFGQAMIQGTRDRYVEEQTKLLKQETKLKEQELKVQEERKRYADSIRAQNPEEAMMLDAGYSPKDIQTMRKARMDADLLQAAIPLMGGLPGYAGAPAGAPQIQPQPQPQGSMFQINVPKSAAPAPYPYHGPIYPPTGPPGVAAPTPAATGTTGATGGATTSAGQMNPYIAKFWRDMAFKVAFDINPPRIEKYSGIKGTVPVTRFIDPSTGTVLGEYPEFDLVKVTATIPYNGRMVTGTYTATKGSNAPVGGTIELPDGTEIPRDFAMSQPPRALGERVVKDATGEYREYFDPSDPGKVLERRLVGPAELVEVPTAGGGKKKVPLMSFMGGGAAPQGGGPRFQGGQRAIGGGGGIVTELDVGDRPVQDKAGDYRLKDNSIPPGTMSENQILSAGGKRVPKAYETGETTYRGAKAVVDDLRKLGDQIFKPRGGISGYATSYVNAMTDPKVQRFLEKSRGLVPALVRQLAQGGRMNERLLERLEELIPHYLPHKPPGMPFPVQPDNWEEFRQKMDDLEGLIKEISNRPENTDPNSPEMRFKYAVDNNYHGPDMYVNKKTGQKVRINSVDEFLALEGVK